LINPGPALVEPSITNQSDANIQKTWDFVEFTFNSAQLYANITYVDFVCLPIALTLKQRSGATQHVSGMAANGLDTVCNRLRAQTQADGRGWDQLIVTKPGGGNLRAVSPNNGMMLHQGLFSSYYQPYVNQVWKKFTTTTLSVDTQAAPGVVSGRVQGDQLRIGTQTFSQPSTADIFSCSTGPFATGSNLERNAIIPRLAAAFNRSTLLVSNQTPNPTGSSQFYKNLITNHYSRIVHQANLDGKGYAFPYDDVTRSGGGDQSGSVFAGDAQLLTVAVGGVGASA
jgi:hypothetical protein